MLSKKYQSAIETSTAFMAKIEDLVREIAIQHSIPYYRIESQMDHNPHMGVEDVYTPVIRIITYFEDTVSKVAEILQSEFDIILGKSIDKKKNRLDSFSYKHIQYIGSLKANRRDLTEYKRCGDKKFEIQLCSMLQDAWSGIEKELGYDNTSFPDESKRDFYRVGALLEMADIEFLKMRTERVKTQAAPVVHETVTHHTVANESAAALAAKAEAVPAPAVTFAEHLQTVVHEVPAQTQPIVEPTVAHIDPAAPVAPIQQPVVHHIPAQPAYAAPVQEQPQPVYAAPQPAPVAPPVVAYVAPQPEPVAPVVHEIPQAIVTPVVAVQEEIVHPLAASTVASVIPQRAMPVEETPAPAPAVPAFGIAPQRVTLSAETPIPEMKVDKFGSLSLAGALAEKKNNIIDEHITDVAKAAPAAEEYIPVVQEEVKQTISFVTPEIPKPIGVPETIAPIAAAAAASIVVPELHLPKTEPVVPNIPDTNSIAARVSEIVHEPIQPVMNSGAAFFEDQPKVNNNRMVALDENAPMTDSSLKEYVTNSKLLKEIDMRIAERAGAKINSEIDIEGDVERLRFLKVFTLKQLHDRLSDNKNDIVAFAEKWIGKDNGGSFDSGISLFYLEYLLVGKKNDPAFAIEYVVKFISDNDYSARYIIPTYNSIRNSADVSNNFSHLTLKA